MERLVVAAILCSLATISLSEKTERCDMCICAVTNSVLRLDCSDGKSRSGEYSNRIRLPYPESYNTYEYDAIQAEFNRNRIKSLSRLNMDDLTKLSLEENDISNIEPGTFIRLKQLKYLSLKDNSIKTLHGKSFQGLLKLDTLNLSDNEILGFSMETFTDLKLLRTLSLSNNKLSNMNGKIFPNSLHTLDISFNYISKIEVDVFDNTNNLAILNLSNNNITEVSTFMFISLRSLTSLDLSYNKILKMDQNSFANLNSLKKLSLSHNALEDMHANAEFPASIEILDISDNLFTDIGAPILSIKNLQELYMQQNQLRSVEISSGSKLKVLNVSGNQIETFSASLCQNLEVLDLSSNKLTAVPGQLHGKVMPALRWVNLDFNPIRQIRFPTAGEDEMVSIGLVNLTWVSVSHLPELEELKEGDFSGLSSTCGGCASNTKATQEYTGELENLEQECIRQLSIRVAHNHRLANIQQGAFKDVTICKLDISYNSLSSLDEGVMDWEALQEVDLQGNPWSCTCPLQWVLDTILPNLYTTNPQLLYELRCESPAALRNKRLVHFYGWKKSALCGKAMMEKMMMEPTQGNQVEVTMGFSGPMLAVVVSLAVVGAILVAVAVVLQRRYTRHYRIRNRRF